MKLNDLIDRDSLRVFNVLFLSVMLTSFILCLASSNEQAFFSVLTRAWQMMAGGAVYLHLVSGYTFKRYRSLISYAGLIGIFTTAYIVNRYKLESQWPSYWSALPVLSACTLLFARDEHNWVLNNKLTQRIGTWSYSIYLWHWPLVIMAGITGVLYELPKPSKILGVLISIFLGYLSYRFIESAHFTKIRSKKSGSMKLAASAALLLLLSVSVVKSEGYLFRFEDTEFFRNLEISQASLTYKVECENYGLRHDHFCHINSDKSGNKILVMGDSHAGHLFPWFEQKAKFNTTFFVKSGCPFIPDFERVGKFKACAEFVQNALQLATSGEYQTVVISQNWDGVSKHSAEVCSKVKNECVPLVNSVNPSEGVNKSRELIEAILDKGVKVVVVDSTPNYEFNIPKELARNRVWNGNIRKDYDASQFFQGVNEFDMMFKELEKNPKFRVISLRPKMCNAAQCRIYDEVTHQPIYRDRDHINPKWMIANGDIFSSMN